MRTAKRSAAMILQQHYFDAVGEETREEEVVVKGRVLTHIGEITQTASRPMQTEDKSCRPPCPRESAQGRAVATGTQTTNMLASCSLQSAQTSQFAEADTCTVEAD